MRFENQAAIVTGGSRGIGRAIAQALIQAGVRIVIAGRDANTGERAAQEIGARFIACDGWWIFRAEVDQTPRVLEKEM